MTTLTQQQIDRIFEFTSQKYIKYYDVQLELVDHIASRIEQMMADDPNLQFEPALQKVYKSFGIFGFTKVQDQKIVEMRQYWQAKKMNIYKSYLTLPLLVFTIALTLVFALLIKSTGLMGAMIILFGLVFIDLLRWARWSWVKKKKAKKRLLMMDTVRGLIIGTSSAPLLISQLIVHAHDNIIFQTYAPWILAPLLCFSVIGIIISRHHLPKESSLIPFNI